MAEKSRIGAKIKRDQLLANELENLWDALYSAMQAACEKVNQYWDSQLKGPTLNDHNSLIYVIGPLPDEPKKRQLGDASPRLDVRIDRKLRQIAARWSGPESSPTIYTIAANGEEPPLCLKLGDKQYSAHELAEILVAEKFLGKDLDS